MMLKDYVPDYTKQKLKTWEAKELIIDEKRAIWYLQNPDNHVEKVCLYRDEYEMFIYGDYGQYTFDNMTCQGSIYNLQYDNLPYQMEKLSRGTRNAIRIYDSHICEKDIFDWFKERLEYRYELDDEEIEAVLEFIKECDDEEAVVSWLKENGLSKLENIVKFVNDCLINNDTEYEWISFLYDRKDLLGQFEEPQESILWYAGKKIDTNFYVSLYALQICKEKMEQYALQTYKETFDEEKEERDR